MKPFLFLTLALLSAALNAQGTVSADTIKETISYRLDEIVISNMTEEAALGEPDEKSKKTQVLSPDIKAAYYFENTVGERTYLKTVMFKVGKVKHKTEVHIRLYKKQDYEQGIYADGKVKEAVTVMPGKQIDADDIVVYLEPGQKGVVEVSLLEYDIEMPKDGLFVSVEGAGYYDADGKKLQNLKVKELTWLEFHNTKSDNFCVWAKDRGWDNINRRIKNDFESFKKEVPKKILKAPNYGLKVVRSI